MPPVPAVTQKPPEQEPEAYDPRTLYEKLQEQKATKQSAFEEKYSIRELRYAARHPHIAGPRRLRVLGCGHQGRAPGLTLERQPIQGTG